MPLVSHGQCGGVRQLLEHLRINVPSSIRERAHVGRARQDPERGAPEALRMVEDAQTARAS
ncbi:MAG: hypothetical protein R2838_13135 [Caldilineaceae bacterium]